MKFKKLLLFSFAFVFGIAVVAAKDQSHVSTTNSNIPSDVIMTPPQGIIKKYYMDFQAHDPAVGFIEDYHNLVKVTFCENGEVYMPNMIRSKTFKTYMKGRFNRAENTISFPSKLIIGWGPNQHKYYYLRACDKNGQLSNKPEFKFTIDQKTGQITSNDSVYLALYFGEDTQQYYDIAGLYKYLPVEEVDNKIDSYTLSYTKSTDTETVLSTKAKGYFENNDFYIKGMNPKYPEKWMKGTLKDGHITFLSRQMANILYNDDPIIMMAMEQTGEDKFTPLVGFELAYDESNKNITGLEGKNSIVMANMLLNEDETTSVNQTYNNFSLTFTPITPAMPNQPEFYNFSADDKEFTFMLPSKDTNDKLLDTDFMSFRLFMNGKPYTFTKAEYPRLKSSEDLLDIPFAFHDYNYINKSNYKRYIYFNAIPEDVETIAVEVTYSVKGQSNTAKRLVYNIKTGKHYYEDASAVTHVLMPQKDHKIIDIKWLDLAGKEIKENNPKGVYLRVTSYDNGTNKIEKVMR